MKKNGPKSKTGKRSEKVLIGCYAVWWIYVTSGLVKIYGLGGNRETHSCVGGDLPVCYSDKIYIVLKR